MKFITPVSMNVTREQFDNDLKEPLEKMGYEIDEKFTPERRGFNDYLHTNFGMNNNLVGFNQCQGKPYIDHYNPKLFLALAAMSDGLENYFEYHLNSNYEFVNGVNQESLVYKNLPKATKEELIKHFSNNDIETGKRGLKTALNQNETPESIISAFQKIKPTFSPEIEEIGKHIQDTIPRIFQQALQSAVIDEISALRQSGQIVLVEDVTKLQSEVYAITGDGEVMQLFNKLLGNNAG